MHNTEIKSPRAVCDFIAVSGSVFTLCSSVTNKRYVYRVISHGVYQSKVYLSQESTEEDEWLYIGYFRTLDYSVPITKLVVPLLCRQDKEQPKPVKAFTYLLTCLQEKTLGKAKVFCQGGKS